MPLKSKRYSFRILRDVENEATKENWHPAG